MLKDQLKIKGQVSLVLTDEYGNVKDTRVENMVVNTGLAYIAGRMLVSTPTVMSHMAVGSSSTTVVKTQTTLVSELGRVELTDITSATTNVSNDATVYTATFGAGIGTGALQEAALFNAGTGGTMLARTTYAVINKGANDSLAVSWKLTVT